MKKSVKYAEVDRSTFMELLQKRHGPLLACALFWAHLGAVDWLS